MGNQFITNQDRLLSDVMNNILPSTEKMYFLVGYFYFSGFREIYRNIEGKHLRILVGLDIEKDLANAIREYEILSEKNISRGKIRQNYYSWLIKAFNETDFFDNTETQSAFRIFLNKIKDGSLEMRKTLEPNHAKLYLFENKPEFNQGGEYPGTLITGSSNLTRSGLRGRHEINVVFRNEYFAEGKKLFDELWDKAVVVADADNYDIFQQEVIEHIWYEKLPLPYMMYLRVLDEYFSLEQTTNIDLPDAITKGRYINLKYQTDAIKQALVVLSKHNGVIVSDVVGLGKSIIASAVAYNLKLKTIIITPPHLKDQWDNDYRYQFNFNAKVYTSGSIEKAVEEDDDEEKLIIIDEAHKYRNELTADYANLHKLCRNKKVVLLTATPFNNRPQDVFAMIRLFQLPAKSTIRTVDNLSARFQELVKEYKKIETSQCKKTATKDEIKQQIAVIAKKIRDILSPVVIRRSRLDLHEIDDYRKDLEVQGVSFPKVNPPEALEYDLGSLTALYSNTLEEIAPEDDEQGFQGTRYRPASYIKAAYKKKWAEKLTGITGKDAMNLFEQGQVNIAKFMRRLLVRRFESSIFSFRESLDTIIKSSQLVLDYYEKLGKLPIYKKADLPDAEDLLELVGEDLFAEIKNINFDELLAKQIEKGLHLIDKSEVEPSFQTNLRADIELLKNVRAKWFPENELGPDPKLAGFKKILKTQLAKEPTRKIVVFTEFADTANYLYDSLKNDIRVFKYTSADASTENKRAIRENFDAGYQKQKNDFDVIIATDAISEGVNLHRAGTIFNYDIPYNPTRVIQRVGRINRINKKVFDTLYIFNYFPSAIGEDETRTKEIATLKISMIHALMGEDTKFLTSEEQLNAFYKERYTQLLNDEDRSWDNPYRNLLNSLKAARPELLKEALRIPPRTKIRRSDNKGKHGVLVFAQKGGEYTFKFGNSAMDAVAISAEDAIKLFEAQEAERPQQVSHDFEAVYKHVKQTLFDKQTHVPYDRGKAEAVIKLRLLRDKVPSRRDYLEDLITVIEKLDSLPAHYLKLIRAISDKTLERDMQTLVTEVSHNYLIGLLSKAEKIDEGEENLILAQEF